MPVKRPKTIKEIQAEKQRHQNIGTLCLLNISRQLIHIHLRPPKNVDFYIGAQDIMLKPGQHYSFKKNRLWMEQIDRLTKQRYIQVLSDSDKLPNKASK